jgi:hypothetical protein
MNENQEFQAELFNEFSGEPAKKRRFIKRPEKQKQITLVISREKLIFSVISVILLYVIFFSLGIERGKKIANRSFNKDVDSSIVLVHNSEIDSQPAAKEQKTMNTKDNITNLEITEQTAETEKVLPELKEFYSIQAAAYSNLSRAEKEAQKVRAEGNEAIIDSSGKYHLLLIGKFEDKKEADALRKKIASKYKGCYVRKYKIKD